jgi:lactate permease
MQFLWSNFVSFELVDLVSSVASLVAGVILLKFWRPKSEWRFDHDDLEGISDEAKPPSVELTKARVARAWMPFVLLSLTVLAWGLPTVKSAMDKRTSWKWEIPGLHKHIFRGEAITGHQWRLQVDLEPAVADIVPISSTGTAIFLAAVISGLLLGVSPRELLRMLGATIARLTPAIATIVCMLALGFVTKSSGMDVVLGLAFTRTNPWFYPIFGTLLGWLGVALTGSDTSSNVLFGNLQRITATKLGLDPILMASANTTGGVMGKMIDAQSIVVAAAATGEGGKEGDLLRAVFWHSIALALMVGVIVWTYAHVLPGFVAQAKG